MIFIFHDDGIHKLNVGMAAKGQVSLAFQSVGLRPTFIQFQNAYPAKIT